MVDLILTTFDWVPETPRGFVRDLRVRWALEEAGLPYRVESVPFRDRTAEHFAHQPFGQVPWLTDGDISIFESGAILLHLSECSDALMPADPRNRSQVLEWLFAALNSVEMPSVPWSLFKFSGDTADTPGRRHLDAFLNSRLQHMEPVLAGREWLAGMNRTGFSGGCLVCVTRPRLAPGHDSAFRLLREVRSRSARAGDGC